MILDFLTNEQLEFLRATTLEAYSEAINYASSASGGEEEPEPKKQPDPKKPEPKQSPTNGGGASQPQGQKPSTGSTPPPLPKSGGAKAPAPQQPATPKPQRQPQPLPKPPTVTTPESAKKRPQPQPQQPPQNQPQPLPPGRQNNNTGAAPPENDEEDIVLDRDQDKQEPDAQPQKKDPTSVIPPAPKTNTDTSSLSDAATNAKTEVDWDLGRGTPRKAAIETGNQLISSSVQKPLDDLQNLGAQQKEQGNTAAQKFGDLQGQAKSTADQALQDAEQRMKNLEAQRQKAIDEHAAKFGVGQQSELSSPDQPPPLPTGSQPGSMSQNTGIDNGNTTDELGTEGTRGGQLAKPGPKPEPKPVEEERSDPNQLKPEPAKQPEPPQQPEQPQQSEQPQNAEPKNQPQQPPTQSKEPGGAPAPEQQSGANQQQNQEQANKDDKETAKQTEQASKEIPTPAKKLTPRINNQQGVAQKIDAFTADITGLDQEEHDTLIDRIKKVLNKYNDSNSAIGKYAGEPIYISKDGFVYLQTEKGTFQAVNARSSLSPVAKSKQIDLAFVYYPEDKQEDGVEAGIYKLDGFDGPLPNNFRVNGSNQPVPPQPDQPQQPQPQGPQPPQPQGAQGNQQPQPQEPQPPQQPQAPQQPKQPQQAPQPQDQQSQQPQGLQNTIDPGDIQDGQEFDEYMEQTKSQIINDYGIKMQHVDDLLAEITHSINADSLSDSNKTKLISSLARLKEVLQQSQNTDIDNLRRYHEGIKSIQKNFDSQTREILGTIERLKLAQTDAELDAIQQQLGVLSKEIAGTHEGQQRVLGAEVEIKKTEARASAHNTTKILDNERAKELLKLKLQGSITQEEFKARMRQILEEQKTSNNLTKAQYDAALREVLNEQTHQQWLERHEKEQQGESQRMDSRKELVSHRADEEIRTSEAKTAHRTQEAGYKAELGDARDANEHARRLEALEAKHKNKTEDFQQMDALDQSKSKRKVSLAERRHEMALQMEQMKYKMKTKLMQEKARLEQELIKQKQQNIFGQIAAAKNAVRDVAAILMAISAVGRVFLGRRR